jgi:hypothetical protein
MGAVGAPLRVVAWDLARGCFDTDPEVQEAMATSNVPQLEIPAAVGDGSAAAVRHHVAGLDEDVLAAQHYGHERLDHLTVEHVLGAR